MEKSDAAELLGVPESEIVEVLDGPAGDLISTTDGQTYVHLPADSPDASGRSGLMFLQPPHDGYIGPFPVYDGTVTTAPVVDDGAKPRRRQRNPKAAAEPTSDDTGQRDTGNDPTGDATGDGNGESDQLEILRAELGALDKDELLAYARDAGVDVQPEWAAERILEVLLDAADPTGGED